MKIKVSLAAEKDIADGAIFYHKINEALSHKFMNEIENSFKRINQFSSGYPEFSLNTRRCLCEKFPYGVIYEIENDTITILGDMHLKRHPEHWKNRLTK